MTYAGNSERAALIGGFRELADYLESNPDVPAPGYSDVLAFPPDGECAGMRAEIDVIAERIGVEARETVGLRTLGDRQSVVAINFNYDPVRAKIVWPGGTATIKLKPLGYTLFPEPEASEEPTRNGSSGVGTCRPIPDGVAFDHAAQWFVDTAEGRLHDQFIPLRPDSAQPVTNSGIYWRPQNATTIWQNDLPPLHPAYGRVGVKHGQQGWTIIRFDGPASKSLRLDRKSV